uniref:UMA domain-containing protein n=1 Tax=Periophthalmus magnuspinnatus TaxID=409849 RepID=A0A3B4BBW3_9GOBI
MRKYHCSIIWYCWYCWTAVRIISSVLLKDSKFPQKFCLQLSLSFLFQSARPLPPHPIGPTFPVAFSSSEPSAAPTSALAGVGSEPAPTLPDLLGDIPFTLAPHILAMQAGFPFIPDVLLSRDINYNLSNFQVECETAAIIVYSNRLTDGADK